MTKKQEININYIKKNIGHSKLKPKLESQLRNPYHTNTWLWIVIFMLKK